MRIAGTDARLLAAISIAIFMGALDLTIIVPALPTIGDSFGMTPTAVSLALSIYAVVYAASVPIVSKLGDVHGHKPLFTISLLLFSAGSAIAALAPSLPVLVGGRVVQAIGGGGLFPIAHAIVGTTVDDEHQGEVLGILMGVFALGGLLGPNLGGFFAQELTWPWIFWVQVPLGGLGLMAIAGQKLPSPAGSEKVDWPGALIVAITFGSLVLGVEGLRSIDQYGFFSLPIAGLFVLSLIGLFALIGREKRTTEPIIDLEFASSRKIAPLLLLSVFIGYTLLGGIVYTPLYAQLMFGLSSLAAGAMLNAAAVGVGLSSWIAGRLTNRWGAKMLVVGGTGLIAGGLACMILLRMSLVGLLTGLLAVGAGLGLSQGPLSHLALNRSPEEHQGQISGLLAITRSMGGAVGISLVSYLLHHAVEQLSVELPDDPAAALQTQAWGSSSSLDAITNAPAHLQTTIREILGAGLLDGWYSALIVAVLGLLLALSLHTDTR